MDVKVVFLIGTIIVIIVGAFLYKKKSFDSRLQVLLVLVAFALAMGWDLLKDDQKGQEEKAAIVLILKSELAETNAVINFNLKILEDDLKALKEKKEVIPPLVLLSTDAWISARLRNNVFLHNTADLLRFVNLYTMIYMVNEKIRYREQYRIQNQPMSNYHFRLEQIDKDVEQVLQKILPVLINAQQALDRVYKWKVVGPSFHIKNGQVIDGIFN